MRPIARIAAEHENTVAQVILRWHTQHGTVAIPQVRASGADAENVDVFDFEPSTEQVAALDALDRGPDGRVGPDLDTSGHLTTPSGPASGQTTVPAMQRSEFLTLRARAPVIALTAVEQGLLDHSDAKTARSAPAASGNPTPAKPERAIAALRGETPVATTTSPGHHEHPRRAARQTRSGVRKAGDPS
jgi:hypothetical protein